MNDPMNAAIPNTDETPASIANKWSVSPLPAFAFSAALLASPMFRPAVVLENPQSMASSAASALSQAIKSGINRRPLSAYPSNAQVLVFSSFIGLGGFMCYDKDPKDGAAVIGTWSIIYFLSNFKKSLWNLKLYPKALTSFAFVNSVVYSAKYLNFI